LASILLAFAAGYLLARATEQNQWARIIGGRLDRIETEIGSVKDRVKRIRRAQREEQEGRAIALLDEEKTA